MRMQMEFHHGMSPTARQCIWHVECCIHVNNPVFVHLCHALWQSSWAASQLGLIRLINGLHWGTMSFARMFDSEVLLALILMLLVLLLTKLYASQVAQPLATAVFLLLCPTGSIH